MHCHLAFLNLSGFVYEAARRRGIEPSSSPRHAAQTFEWVIHSQQCPTTLSKKLCHCEADATGIIGELFGTNTRLIGKDELGAVLDDIRVRALKEGIDLNSQQVKEQLDEVKKAVRAHNASLQCQRRRSR